VFFASQEAKTMWPTGFRLFQASPQVLTLARLARDATKAEEDLPQLDLTCSQLPDPRQSFDPQVAQEAIGERLLSLLGALAISCDEAAAKVLVMPVGQHFAPDVRAGLAEYLGLAAEGRPFERFLSQLAREFYHWVKTHPRERREFGLELDAQGAVFLRCAELRPDLEPLEE
jgi:hypothetical protein